MRAKEAIMHAGKMLEAIPEHRVSSEMHLLDLFPRLLEAPGRLLGVEDKGELVGVVSESSMLEALSRQLSSRDDCSVVEIDCAPADYSASRIACAVEDADVHLVDLLSVPSDGGKIRVTLRVRCDDPESVVRSLNRYGYDVVSVAQRLESMPSVSYERLLAVQAMINV